MTIVIPFSHKDAIQARRLVLWLKRQGDPGAPVLLAASKRGAESPYGQQTIALAREYFDASLFIPHDENEKGWPRSATHLFQRTLKHVEDDLFWLEADCVPLRTGWFAELRAAFDAAGVPFVGRKVVVAEKDRATVPDHMTGCAFYGREWRRVVPDLADDYTGGMGAWDVDFAGKIMPHFADTCLIHHFWDRNNPRQRVRLADVEPGAALYHQCKTGALMAELGPGFQEWALTQLKLHSFVSDMPRFFLTKNASKTVFAGGKSFQFEPVLYFAPTASFWGVHKAADDAEAELLSDAAAKGVISTLSEEEFNGYHEKKNWMSASPSLPKLKEPIPQSGPGVIRTGNVLLVEEAPAKTPVEVPGPVAAETVSEALETKALPPQKETLPRRPASRKN